MAAPDYLEGWFVKQNLPERQSAHGAEGQAGLINLGGGHVARVFAPDFTDLLTRFDITYSKAGAGGALVQINQVEVHSLAGLYLSLHRYSRTIAKTDQSPFPLRGTAVPLADVEWESPDRKNSKPPGLTPLSPAGK